ncbi:hypothetical protein G6F56_013132 [Rhizopus delemar]|nr:hypothetical protein G6F56_013132 [Rhizopus delemar]
MNSSSSSNASSNPKVYQCPYCNHAPFSTQKRLRYHQTSQDHLPPSESQTREIDNSNDEDVVMNESLSNNPSADYHINEDFYTAYHSFHEASVQHGKSRVFKCPEVNQAGFTRSLMHTINFADIINEHNISRDASRQLVRFVQTVKEDKQLTG